MRVRLCLSALIAVCLTLPALADTDPLVTTPAGKLRGEAVGTHLDGAEDFRVRAYRSPTLLVMGSEGPGLSAELAAACDRLVKIPMAGTLDSLNLAIATALTLYQIRGPHLKL